MSIALGIAAADGRGTSAADVRRILSAIYPSRGILSGLAVTGQTGLAYRVASGAAVCSRGASDGCSLALFEGGLTPAVAANTAASPRIDSVWLCAHDQSQGNADSLVALGVTQGTPAASPVAPAVPTYATELARMLLPAGATTTANATRSESAGYAVAAGGSQGVLLDLVDTANTDVSLSSRRTAATGTISLASDRVLDFRFTITMGSFQQGPYAGGAGSVYVILRIDGKDVRTLEVKVFADPNATSQFIIDTRTVQAGSHTVAMLLQSQVGGKKCRFYYSDIWAGQRLQVVDLGAAR